MGEKPGSTVISATCTVRRSRAANLVGPSLPGVILEPMNFSVNSGVPLQVASPVRTPSSYRQSNAKLPSHRRVALARIASNTGLRSLGELLMMPSTCAIAICCSSDRASSLRDSVSSQVRLSSCSCRSFAEEPREYAVVGSLGGPLDLIVLECRIFRFGEAVKRQLAPMCLLAS